MSRSENNLNVANNSNNVQTPSSRNELPTLMQILNNQNTHWCRIVIKKNAVFIQLRTSNKKYLMGKGTTFAEAYEELKTFYILQTMFDI